MKGRMERLAPSSTAAPAGLERDTTGQPQAPTARTAVLALVTISLMALFLTIHLISMSIRQEIAGLEAQLQPLQSTLAKASTPEPRVLEMMKALPEIEASIKEIEALRPTVAAIRADWPAAITAIGSYDPTQLTLLSVTQSGREVTLRGRASSELVVAAYARSLEGSGTFARVAIQSVRSSAVPLAPLRNTPTRPPTPTPLPTPTPTPDPRDPYEPNDAQPRDIFLGHPQVHNFYPAGDVDQVRFLAKAGRVYRVYTSDLAPGVDTLLSVRVGESTYVNDDRQAGTLRSEVVFQVPTDADRHAIVEVRNRGSYGPEMTYRITAEEIVATPTPTPTRTASPPPTATPTRTATPMPASTPTRTTAVTARTAPRLAAARPPGLAFPMAAPAYQAAQPMAVEFVIILVLRAAPL